MDDIVVVFSFVGMKTQEIIYKGEADLQVVMKDDVTEVDEVVVTGIFKKAKESYTGAVTTITAKDLAMVGNRNVLTSTGILHRVLTSWMILIWDQTRIGCLILQCVVRRVWM